MRRPRFSGTVLARLVANVLAFATKDGLNREALLEGAGLTERDLAPPDSYLPFSALVAVWQLIAKAKAGFDPEFGIRWGAAVRARDLGLLGYAMAYSANLEMALLRLVRYGRILTDTVQFEMETPHTRRRAIAARAHAGLGAALPFAVDSRLAALLAACREITGVAIIPVEVTFTYAQPRSIAEHHRFFRCALRFKQRESKLIFLERDFRLPVTRGDEALAGYLSEHAEHVLRTLTTGASTRERVRSAIWALLTEGRPTLDHVATALQMPPRTLQRHLAREGTSLHQEIEHIRKAMALATLQGRALAIDELAFLLGYTEPSSFYRSFKRWTGRTPRQYRLAAAALAS
ncbi:MAG: AraC family transcriptional regulator [Gemmatimonadales bacterium]